MKSNKTYAVFGLGRYGVAVARELVENGAEVIAVDTDQRIVNDAAVYLPVCKCADVTDAEVISRLGIGSVDTVIVCMASNLEASVMAITLCKEAGVKTVIAKCANEMHQKILLRVGADQVVFPENESGIRLAKNLLSSGFIDMISLSKDVSMVEIDVKEEWIGKNLIELNLRKKYGINVVALKKGEEVSVSINPEQQLDGDTTLIVIANTAKLGKLK
ncbi:MAG: TrkA family potassium uptake protein [Clostridia bacterium]|nr:TrkA family potassium uptake protein [Clostridia bacterium]